MIPGMGKISKQLEGAELDGKEMKHIEAIILSMTKKERSDPSLLNGSRRKRIATGSGTHVQDVNRVIRQFMEMRKQMKKGMKGIKGMKGMKNPGSGGFGLPGPFRK